MLVLSRTVGKVIFIGDDISVHVLALNGSQVKFGVAAPTGVHVHRAEVCQNTREHQAAELDATPDP